MHILDCWLDVCLEHPPVMLALAVQGVAPCRHPVYGRVCQPQPTRPLRCLPCACRYPTNGFVYMYNNPNGGVTTQANYPFTATGNGQTCQPQKIVAPLYGLGQPGYRAVASESKQQLLYVSPSAPGCC